MKRTTLIIAAVALFAFLLAFNFASLVDASKDKRRANASPVGKSNGRAAAGNTRALNRSNAPIPVLSRQDKAEPPLIDLSLSRSHSFMGKSLEVDEEDFNDPDLPAKRSLRNGLDEEEYHRLKDEYLASLRGLDLERPFVVGPRRSEALNRMNAQEESIRAAAKSASPNAPSSFADWAEIGPTSLPNGQYQGGLLGTVNGRATAVVVDPTDSNTIYLGTAQGGVWRSLNGGANWTSIFDTAQSLAIGSIALAPSSPTTLYVGTGEPNNSGDSFFGVGVYRIDNAKTTPVLTGPINPSITTGTAPALTYNCFNGRAISKILVHPTDPATIFVSTAAGIGGAGGNALSNTIPPLALRGVFRSTNATAAAGAVTFSKIIVNTDGSLDGTPATGNTSIFDMVLDPGFDGAANQTLLVATSGAATGGAVMRSTDALAATPTFTQTLFPGFNGLVMKLAINKVGAVVTAYVATNEPSVGAGCGAEAGRVRKSVDGGVTWSVPLVAAEGYCGGQCSYDNPIAVDPTDANIVYLAGNARGTCSEVMQRSADGGTTFLRDDTNLHADAHYIFIDPNVMPHKVWFANDGGIYSRNDAVATTPWTSNNNAPLGVFQFVSVAVHPTDPFFTVGGTQDNGTEAQQTTSGNWTSAEGGDGGFALIDQSATDTGANLKAMYHTFFNLTNNLVGFDRAELGSCLLVKNSWAFRGNYPGQVGDPTPSCDGTAFDAPNGLNVADTPMLFYAPMALGPGGVGNPNTVYFGTNKLYRSVDRGDTMVIASQNPLIAGVAVSAIGISPTDDNVRIVGMRNGNVFATTTGSTTLTNTGFPFPTNATGSTVNRHVGRAVIDPANSNTAYVTLSYYTNPATAGKIWRTTNLNAATPTWTAIGSTANGLPDIPVNAFVVDANDPTAPGVSVLYAGTDIGVYHSRNAGATWLPFGQGLPRVAVFDMAIQPTGRILRIATHGRGMWEKLLPGNPTAAPASISGKITTTDGSPLAGVTINLSGARTGRTITDSNGNYRFNNIDTGNFYTVAPALVNYHFGPESRSFSLLANMTDAVFTATRAVVIAGNAIDTPEYFVRQHYLDFLNREPDQDGFDFWSDQILSCGADAACKERRTINVSAAYFLSVEFGKTGGFVDSLYRASYNRRPLFNEFMPDTAIVAHNVIVGPNIDWAGVLEGNKQAFMDAWVLRPAFVAANGGLTNDSFVDTLIAHTGVSFSASERSAFISSLNGGTATRAGVLRQIAENERFASAKRNEMFVMMEYFGYLRRDPDAAGYQFWLDKLNQFGGNFEQAEMVKAFIVSGEYRARFPR